MYAMSRIALPEILSPVPESAGDGEPDGITRMLRAIRTHLGMDVAFASEIRDGQVIIRHADTVEDGPIKVGAAFSTEDAYCQRIIDGRLPQLIPDTRAIAEAAALECTAAMPVGAHISVPLLLKDGSTYGTFCCFSRAADPSLTQRDLQTLRAFADFASAEIEAELAREAEHREIGARIDDVIARGPIGIVYQPIQKISNGSIVGVEALARFEDCETRGPEKWFAEAAEVERGVELELAAIRVALAGCSYFPSHIYVAVNVSPATILSGKLEALLAPLPPGRVMIEITEHESIVDYAALARALAPLRDRAALAIDDVGAGYSGLRHILDLAPDLIKLDMSLVRDVDTDPARRALALALVSFASGIDCEIVAEGVESAGELAALRELGVPMAQGYYLARPMPLMAAVQYLSGDRA